MADFRENKPPVLVPVAKEIREAIKHTAVLIIGDTAYLQVPAGQLLAELVALKQTKRLLERHFEGEDFQTLYQGVCDGLMETEKKYEPYVNLIDPTRLER